MDGPLPSMLQVGAWDDQGSMLSPNGPAARYGRRSNLSPDASTQRGPRHSGGVGDSTAEALGRVRAMIGGCACCGVHDGMCHAK